MPNPELVYDLEAQFEVLHERNGEIRICCPFCGDDEGFHLYINPQKNVYHCFRCDAKGKFSSLIARFKIQSTRETHKNFKYTDVVASLNPSKDEVAPLNINEFKPIPVGEACLNNVYYQYLRERGFLLRDIIDYRLHYADQGKYKYRIIIPCFENGEFTYFTARTILNNPEIHRYLNPPKGITKYTRAEVVFNLDAIEQGAPCTIMEGSLNAIVCGRDAVACYGKFVTDIQLSKLLAKQCSVYTVALDSDAQKESIDLCKKLVNRGHRVRLARFPEDQDAADLGREGTRRIIDAAEPVTHGTIDRLLIAL